MLPRLEVLEKQKQPIRSEYIRLEELEESHLPSGKNAVAHEVAHEDKARWCEPFRLRSPVCQQSPLWREIRFNLAVIELSSTVVMCQASGVVLFGACLETGTQCLLRFRSAGLDQQERGDRSDGSERSGQLPFQPIP